MDKISLFISYHPFLMTSIVCFLVMIIPISKIIYNMLKDPDKIQHMTDTTFDYIDEQKDKFKDEWKRIEAEEMQKIEQEEEMKKKLKEEKKRQRQAKKSTNK